MGFPVGYTDVFMPKAFIRTLSFLAFTKTLLFSLFSLLGLSALLESDNSNTNFLENPSQNRHQHDQQPPLNPPPSAALIRELLPVVKFSDLVSGAGERSPEESCAVCLYEFEGEDEMRCLKNCKHVFHRACLDRWIDHDHDTCPLCRTGLVPDEMVPEFNRKLWAVTESSVPFDFEDFYSDYFNHSIDL